MARFDVDSSATTYHPGDLQWARPRLRRGDGSSTLPVYRSCQLFFSSDTGIHLPAAYEEWEAFDNGATHTIILPPPDDVAGSDDTFSNVHIEVSQPAFTGVNVSAFTVTVTDAEV